MKPFKFMLLALIMCIATACGATQAAPGQQLFSELFWYLIPLEAAVVTAVTASCVKWFKIPEGGWRQAIAWVVGFCVVALAWVVGIFVMPEPKWVNFAITGLVLGLVSNGVYDIPTIRGIIEKIWRV